MSMDFFLSQINKKKNNSVTWILNSLIFSQFVKIYFKQIKLKTNFFRKTQFQNGNKNK